MQLIFIFTAYYRYTLNLICLHVSILFVALYAFDVENAKVAFCIIHISQAFSWSVSLAAIWILQILQSQNS